MGVGCDRPDLRRLGEGRADTKGDVEAVAVLDCGGGASLGGLRITVGGTSMSSGEHLCTPILLRVEESTGERDRVAVSLSMASTARRSSEQFSSKLSGIAA